MNKILIKDNKFKSLIISVNYILPLIEEEVGKNALVALILQQGCDKYKSEKEIEIALAALYNAAISVNIEKLGDNYSITFSLDILNKKYIKKDVIEEALEILRNIIYVPYLENGVFYDQYVNREKEAIISRINELKNNKKKYAVSRLEQEMFKGEAYSVSRYGKIEDIRNATSRSIYDQYKKIISESKITVVVCGNTDGYENILELVTEKLKIIIQESSVEYVDKKNKNTINVTKNIEEFEELNQSILCMGLKLIDISREDMYKVSMYNAILGETPASKLFQNVREKESLAYFANSQYIRFKDVIYIYTGINISNLEKAKQVIINQIDDMKNGNITDEEFEIAKKHSISNLRLMKDNKESVAMYTIGNNIFFGGRATTLDDIEQGISKVVKQEVVDIANKLYIDTIYLLGGKK